MHLVKRIRPCLLHSLLAWELGGEGWRRRSTTSLIAFARSIATSRSSPPRNRRAILTISGCPLALRLKPPLIPARIPQPLRYNAFSSPLHALSLLAPRLVLSASSRHSIQASAPRILPFQIAILHVHFPTAFHAGLAQSGNGQLPARLAPGNVLAPIPSVHHVVNLPFVRDPQLPCHTGKPAHQTLCVNSED